jgi:vacuolar-type H+-ATPase subunit F/Vma7
MSRIVAIGEATELAGYALAGVDVQPATRPDEVRRLYLGLGEDVGLVLLTAMARRAIPSSLDRGDVLWIVLPQ